ncbi:MAG: ABC transporter permease [Rhodospirillales bacterium 69-11]|nr:ABC transporter substrate-binding protein [Rhodospirillales bacterium]OJW29637.1 MAG: ABC transporter permease [Rhodospirillales bacterium 69-11]
MNLKRRHLLASAAASVAVATPTGRARAQRPVLRIGIMNDQSGPYRDLTGPTSVICTRQAVQEWGDHGFDIEITVADHQNKPDLAASIAKKWYDQDGIDVIQDGGASSCALVITSIAREKNKIYLSTSTATSDLTGKACTPNTIHWVTDTYMASKSTSAALTKTGGDTWFFITANYAFGQALQRDATKFVTEAGGKVLGANVYPFPETTDFSAALVQAQASGAKVIGLANSGLDTVNSIKQASEFGVVKGGQKLAGLIMYSTDVHSIGLDTAQGLVLSETYYWDLNDRTRAFMNRIKPKVTLWPNSIQAGQYSSALHYFKAVADMGAAASKADGAATIARMKAMPTDDDCFGAGGKIREDGRKIHPCYLFEVKKPADSKQEWDLMKPVATTPAEEAFRPLSDHACPMLKA